MKDWLEMTDVEKKETLRGAILQELSTVDNWTVAEEMRPSVESILGLDGTEDGTEYVETWSWNTKFSWALIHLRNKHLIESPFGNTYDAPETKRACNDWIKEHKPHCDGQQIWLITELGKEYLS